MEHPVHNHGMIEHFKVDSAIIGSESVECFSISDDLPKAITVKMSQIGLGDFKGIEEFELVERIHPGDFRCADFVEDNL